MEELDEEIRNLVKDMFETMYHAEGIGLAAPQVGVSSRVIVVDVRHADEDGAGPLALINPKVVESGRKKDRPRRVPEYPRDGGGGGASRNGHGGGLNPTGSR